MIGETFGVLRVIELAGIGRRGSSWICECVCGNTIRLVQSQLSNPRFKKCRCAGDTREFDPRIKVDPVLRKAYLDTYISWASMHARVRYKTSPCYNEIDIDLDWYDFSKFLTEMGPRPSKEHSIDREDPDDHYYKGNCRWILKTINSSLARTKKGELHHKAVLNEEIVRWCRQRYAQGGISITEIAAMFGITRMPMWQAIRHHTWKHVQ